MKYATKNEDGSINLKAGKDLTIEEAREAIKELTELSNAESY